MKQHRFTQWVIPRGLAPLTAAVALAAVVGITADHSSAAASNVKTNINQGRLTVTGTSAADEIALRLRAGDPTVLEVVTGGSVARGISRDDFDEIVVNARFGDDLLRIDEANGIFTDTEATTLDGQAGNDELLGGSGAETLRGSAGSDSADGNRGNDVAFLGFGNDSFTWDPGDGSDTVEARERSTRWSSTAPALPRTSTSRPTAGAFASSATSATSSWTSTTSSVSISEPSGARTTPS